MELVHKKTNTVISSDLRVLNTFFQRGKGLMFEKEMIGDGVLIEPCMSIHNCFVFFPIDVLFLSKENKIVKIIRSFKPWRFSGVYLSSKKVVELPEGTLNSNVSVGDFMEVRGV